MKKLSLAMALLSSLLFSTTASSSFDIHDPSNHVEQDALDIFDDIAPMTFNDISWVAGMAYSIGRYKLDTPLELYVWASEKPQRMTNLFSSYPNLSNQALTWVEHIELSLRSAQVADIKERIGLDNQGLSAFETFLRQAEYEVFLKEVWLEHKILQSVVNMASETKLLFDYYSHKSILANIDNRVAARVNASDFNDGIDEVYIEIDRIDLELDGKKDIR